MTARPVTPKPVPVEPVPPRPLHLETEEEVAERTRIPARTLRNYRWLGVGPPWLKVGRHARYVPAQVDRWLLEQKPDRELA